MGGGGPVGTAGAALASAGASNPPKPPGAALNVDSGLPNAPGMPPPNGAGVKTAVDGPGAPHEACDSALAAGATGCEKLPGCGKAAGCGNASVASDVAALGAKVVKDGAENRDADTTRLSGTTEMAENDRKTYQAREVGGRGPVQERQHHQPQRSLCPRSVIARCLASCLQQRACPQQGAQWLDHWTASPHRRRPAQAFRSLAPGQQRWAWERRVP